ncbi:MAG: LysR substrate-binding domain-containing protein [Pseudomonadota bacterium]
MFVGMDRLSDIANTIRTTAGGIVSVGVIPAFSQIVTPEAFHAFSELHLGVKIMATIKNTPEIVDGVQAHQYDIGIVGQSPPYEGVETLFHTTVPYVCLVPDSHWAANVRGELDLHTLVESEAFVTFGRMYPDEMLEIDSELSAKLSDRSRISAANTLFLASLVRTTGALAIVDPFTAEVGERLGGVIGRPIKQSLKYHVGVIGMGPGTMSRAARDMVEIFISQLQKH